MSHVFESCLLISFWRVLYQRSKGQIKFSVTLMYCYCVTERQMESRSLHGCLFLGPSLYSPRPCQRTVWRGSFAPPCGHFASLVRSFATLIARVPSETLRVSPAHLASLKSASLPPPAVSIHLRQDVWSRERRRLACF